MSVNRKAQRNPSSRAASTKWTAVAIAVLVVTVAAIVTGLVLHRGQDEDNAPIYNGAGSGALVTSPYDLVELPADTDLKTVGDAVLVSVFVPNESGILTSYGMRTTLPDAQALVDAVKNAEKVDLAGTPAESGDEPIEARLTFVLPSRKTLTFDLHLDQGLIARESRVWRPADDLKTLIQAAIAGPG